MTEPMKENATARDIAIVAAKAADSKKATDIIVQEVAELIGVTEYFVIVTASNNRQVRAIVEEVDHEVKRQVGIDPLHREETRDGSWELLDYGGVVVHVFQPETREYYRLEALWNEAPIMDLAAEAGIEDAVYSDRIASLLARDEDGTIRFAASEDASDNRRDPDAE